MKKTIAIAASGPLLVYLLFAYVLTDFNTAHWTIDQRGGSAALMVVFLMVSGFAAVVERDER